MRFPAVLLPRLRKNLTSDHDCYSGEEGLGPHVAAIETVLGAIGWKAPDVERDATVTGLSWREAGALATIIRGEGVMGDPIMFLIVDARTAVERQDALEVLAAWVEVVDQLQALEWSAEVVA